MKKVTVPILRDDAKGFAATEPPHAEPFIFGVTDGKPIAETPDQRAYRHDIAKCASSENIVKQFRVWQMRR